MVWWFVMAAVVLLVAVALWRLDTRVKRREGYTSERHRTGTLRRHRWGRGLRVGSTGRPQLLTRAAIAVDAAEGLCELRAVLLKQQEWRVREGIS